MQKIVIAIDSFKGCLSSKTLSEAITHGIKDIFPEATVRSLAIADGGEGSLDILLDALQGKRITCQVSNPLRLPVEASYGWIESQKLAIVEMASASGLTLIPFQEGNVMRTTSYGTGQLIADALHRGCRHLLLTIGGSATNDAGIGLLQALGFRFLNQEGQEVADGGVHLSDIVSVDESQVFPEVRECSFDIAVDVKNPFYGEEGAAYVFAPQKGATPGQVKQLDEAMRYWAEFVRRHYATDLQQIAGSGAAGGLGGGCAVFLKARLHSGIELIKQVLHFDEEIKDADLIITGEGKIDFQTSQGKVISGVLESAKRFQIPVIALTGNCQEANPILESEELLSVFSIQAAPVTLNEAMEPSYTYRQTRQVVKNLMKLIRLLC